MKMNRQQKHEMLELLRQQGNPLEVGIAQRGDLRPVLLPYAAVWVEYILPRRSADDPWSVATDWRDFVGSHLTALLHVSHAHKKHLLVMNVADLIRRQGEDAELSMALHDAVSSFRDHVADAAKWLGQAYDEAPVETDRSQIALRLKRWSESGRPAGPGGSLKFFRRLPALVGKGLYRQQYPRLWNRFLRAMKREWWRLYKDLGRTDADRNDSGPDGDYERLAEPLPEDPLITHSHLTSPVLDLLPVGPYDPAPPTGM